MRPYYFKSDLFEIEPGEDEEINPGVYGKQLASWLSNRLRTYGYDVEVIGEDWGRCLMCSRSPYWLWVGCSNVYDKKLLAGKYPATVDVTWQCFVVAEAFFLKRLFKRINTRRGEEKLHEELGQILRSEKHIQLVDEA